MELYLLNKNFKNNKQIILDITNNNIEYYLKCQEIYKYRKLIKKIQNKIRCKTCNNIMTDHDNRITCTYCGICEFKYFYYIYIYIYGFLS